MPDPVTGVVGGSTVLGLVGAKKQGSAAKQAAGQQAQSAQSGIDLQREQFEQVQELLRPYVEQGGPAIQRLSPYEQSGLQATGMLGGFLGTGSKALQGQEALAGLAGVQAQQAQISAIEQSPEFQALQQQGENALLQNASATGGLRGGNMQAALAQFRPELLNSLVQQKYSQLGGLAGQGGNVAQFLQGQGQAATQNIANIGQASAAGTGVAGQNMASNVSNLLAQQGAAQAGGTLGRAQAFQSGLSALGGGLGLYGQQKGYLKF